MRALLGVLVWAALAVIGAVYAGFWGFLGVAFLYVLYYALLRPRVIIHTTPQEVAREVAATESRQAAETALLLDAAAKAMAPPKKKAPLRVRPGELATGHIECAECGLQLPNTADGNCPSCGAGLWRATAVDASKWGCTKCGATNDRKRTRCRKCDAWNPT